jgi:hypothetical protein
MLRHLRDMNSEHNHGLAVPPQAAPTARGQLHLVALSFAVACFASYTALDLAGGSERLRKPYDLQSLFKAICELRAKSVAQSASRASN